MDSLVLLCMAWFGAGVGGGVGTTLLTLLVMARMVEDTDEASQ